MQARMRYRCIIASLLIVAAGATVALVAGHGWLAQREGEETERVAVADAIHGVDAAALVFRPRKDVEPWQLSFPLDWAANPFHDVNWQFQLHAWKMIDKWRTEYERTRN